LAQVYIEDLCITSIFLKNGNWLAQPLPRAEGGEEEFTINEMTKIA
jgi:hypothetical protein